jgi:branched-chain amino acid transport system permease protein
MLGAAVFTLFQQQLSSVFPWWRLLLGAVFVLVVLFLPTGLVSLPARLSGLTGGPPEDGLAEEPEVRTDD